MVAEGIVLSRVQHFQKGRGRVSLVVRAHLVHLVQKEHRISSTSLFQGFQNAPRHSPHIGAAMAADLRLIPYAPQGGTDKLPAQGLGHRTSQRGLAHPRRPHQAQNRRILPVSQLAHRQELQDALLDLFQPVVVAIQHSRCRLDVVDILRQALPRHGQQVVNIGADNSSLLGHALSPFQPLQLLLHGLHNLVREVPLAQPFLVFLNIPQNAVLVTQLIVDGLDLLPEIIFLLHLLNLAAHPGANLALNIQDILFPLQKAVQLFKPFLHIDALKNSLPVVQLQIDMAGNHICQPPGIIYNRNRYHGICRNFLAALDPLLKLVHNHTNQGLHLYGLVNLVMVLPDIGNQVVILLLNGTDNLAAVKALYQHSDCPVRQLHQMLYLSHRAHAVQI